jgi:hypothetical protein
MIPYGSEWQDGKQEIDLPLHRQGSPGKRETSGPERVEGLRERAGGGDRQAGGAGT